MAETGPEYIESVAESRARANGAKGGGRADLDYLAERIGRVVSRTRPVTLVGTDQELLGKIVSAARLMAKEPADKRPKGAVLAAGLLALEGKQHDAAEEFFTAEVAESVLELVRERVEHGETV